MDELTQQRKDITVYNLNYNYKTITGVTNTINADIILSEDKMLVFQLPYSKGWTLYVDGNKCETFKSNIAFLSAPIEKGHHDIVLKYSTPGLKYGVIISLIGILLFIITYAYENSYKRKKDAIHKRLSI